MIREVFVQPTQEKARELWRAIAASAHNSLPKLAQAMEAAEDDVLAYMTFPAAHRQKLHSTNTLERLNKEVKRRADVVGIFPNEASIIRLVGAVLMEQNDEWQLQHRYLSLEPLADLGQPATRIRSCLFHPPQGPYLHRARPETSHRHASSISTTQVDMTRPSPRARCGSGAHPPSMAASIACGAPATGTAFLVRS
jgi:hypothetical protein